MRHTPTAEQKINVWISRWAVQAELGHKGRAAELAAELFAMFAECDRFCDARILAVYRISGRARNIAINTDAKTIEFVDGRGEERRKA